MSTDQTSQPKLKLKEVVAQAVARLREAKCKAPVDPIEYDSYNEVQTGPGGALGICADDEGDPEDAPESRLGGFVLQPRVHHE